MGLKHSSSSLSHSPLTGIFLIRTSKPHKLELSGLKSQSPDGDFFDPDPPGYVINFNPSQVSQSPDGECYTNAAGKKSGIDMRE
jgi:hypothetical protein